MNATATRSTGRKVKFGSYEFDVAPEIGMEIRGDEWAWNGILKESNCPEAIPGYAGSDFSVEMPSGRSINCNVIVTGRTLQMRSGVSYVRCLIVIPGDCEPDTEFSGWIKF